MTTWTHDELDAADAAHEIQVAARRRDGTLRTPVTIWLVRLDDDLYVRSVNGPGAASYRGARATREGYVHAGGVEHDVEFTAADHALDDRIDAAYRTKYRHSPSAVSHINSPQARSTTLRIVPRT